MRQSRRFLVLLALLGLTFSSLISAPQRVDARARLIVVFPLRSTPELASRAAEATQTVVARLGSIDGYDAQTMQRPASGTLGAAAAGNGAELYVVGQLLADQSGFQLVLASFEAATDRPLGEYRGALQATNQLPEQPDLRALLQSVPMPLASTVSNFSSGTGNGVAIPTGLAVGITLDSPISSSSAQAGDRFTFRATRDVISNGFVVIQRGAQGEGQIAVVERTGGNGHPGKLGLQFNWIASVDGSKIQLTNTQQTDEGEAKKGASSTATIATYVLLGPLGLFAHNFVKGKDVTLDDRSTITAYVDHTVHVTSGVSDTVQPGFAR